MEVIICSSAERASILVARLISDAIKQKPASVLGLATGRTPELVYKRLCALHLAEQLDFSEVTTFNLDEYIGIPASHPQSYRSTMQRELFDHINIKPSKTFLPNGMGTDLEAECVEYERKIIESGGIDLQLLGIGLNGHLAFNEPLSSLTSRTRTKSLTPETREQNAAFFGGADRVPSRAITMGVGTILESRWCILLATGASKADILHQAVEGPMQSVVPASALQMHRRCTVIVDEAAAAKLQLKDYYRWVFANEPEWAPYRSDISSPP
jgi:glucosamine-6-phosphate deaminase